MANDVQPILMTRRNAERLKRLLLRQISVLPPLRVISDTDDNLTIGLQPGSDGSSSSPLPMLVWTNGAAVDGLYPWEAIVRNSANTAWVKLLRGMNSDDPYAPRLAIDFGGATGLPTHTKGVLFQAFDENLKARLTLIRIESRTTYLARITGNASLASTSVDVGGGGSVTVDYKWKYAFTEVERDGSGVADVSGGRTGTTSGTGTTIYAINMDEINHSGTYSSGVDITGSSYPQPFRPRPIGGGGTDNTHKYDRVVEITEAIDKNGNMVRQFSAMPSHDGLCE